jgi:hypothetical protein
MLKNSSEYTVAAASQEEILEHVQCNLKDKQVKFVVFNCNQCVYVTNNVHSASTKTGELYVVTEHDYQFLGLAEQYNNQSINDIDFVLDLFMVTSHVLQYEYEMNDICLKVRKIQPIITEYFSHNKDIHGFDQFKFLAKHVLGKILPTDEAIGGFMYTMEELSNKGKWKVIHFARSLSSKLILDSVTSSLQKTR